MNTLLTALVTGGNRGIGLAIAKQLAERNIRVLMGCREIKLGKAVAKDLPENIIPVEIDLSDEQVLSSQLGSLSEKYPQIDVLVNNAGVLESGNALEVSEVALKNSMRVNFEAPFQLIRHLLPAMIEHNYGRIVNVSSAWGSFDEGLSGPTAYSISKSALNALTLSFAQTIPRTVKINSACPGWVRTRMGGYAASRSTAQAAHGIVWLANVGQDGPTGGFFRDSQLIDW